MLKATYQLAKRGQRGPVPLRGTALPRRALVQRRLHQRGLQENTPASERLQRLIQAARPS